ncbi:ABC-type transport auxiliary lipoprotein family protein [Poseidonibacter antarcticus]|uniref:ABC-type transport auxiliary lipoprotein family protein n=1 Tax=Poseidonibacter antarcticus TaxID=2478538 RepID=UPI000EF54EB6|nr:hypothetical protein [Poseidonibacter antarcticus]
MKNSVSFFICFFISIIVSGCTLKQDVLPTNLYSIDFKVNKNTFSTNSKSIYVEIPKVNKNFNSRKIFYSTKPYLFEKYAINKWINSPSYMIHNNLTQGIIDSNIFNIVLQEKANIDFDYILKTNVINLYNSIENEKSYAIVKVRFILVSGKKLVKTFTYNKRILSQKNNPYGFVLSTNKAFEEIINDLSFQLSEIK